MTQPPDERAARDRRVIPGTAIAALTLGLASLAVIPFSALFALLLAIATIGVSLAFRRELRSDPMSHGSTTSLLGFIAALLSLLLAGLPYLFSLFFLGAPMF